MKHLTSAERNQLQALKRAGHSQQYIADIIGYSQSTISRELSRNSTKLRKVYNANKAQRRSERRKQKSYDSRIRWYDNGFEFTLQCNLFGMNTI